MPTTIEATTNENGVMPGLAYERIRSLAHGIEWWDSLSGEHVYATATVTFADGSTVGGLIRRVGHAHVGALRDLADVWMIAGCPCVYVLNQGVMVREITADHHVKIKRAVHVAVSVPE